MRELIKRLARYDVTVVSAETVASARGAGGGSPPEGCRLAVTKLFPFSLSCRLALTRTAGVCERDW